MNIAIFGGSFNPVHIGHYAMVREVNRHFDIGSFFIVPAFKNPLKTRRPAIPIEIRLNMLEATFSEFENVTISTFELENGKTSYTVNTVEHFATLYPGDRLLLVMGADSLSSFHLWAKADRILELCSIIAFNRPAMIERSKDISIPGKKARILWIDVEIPDISATEIRNASLETVKSNRWLHPYAYSIWETFIRGSDHFQTNTT